GLSRLSMGLHVQPVAVRPLGEVADLALQVLARHRDGLGVVGERRVRDGRALGHGRHVVGADQGHLDRGAARTGAVARVDHRRVAPQREAVGQLQAQLVVQDLGDAQVSEAGVEDLVRHGRSSESERGCVLPFPLFTGATVSGPPSHWTVLLVLYHRSLGFCHGYTGALPPNSWSRCARYWSRSCGTSGVRGAWVYVRAPALGSGTRAPCCTGACCCWAAAWPSALGR